MTVKELRDYLEEHEDLEVAVLIDCCVADIVGFETEQDIIFIKAE